VLFPPGRGTPQRRIADLLHGPPNVELGSWATLFVGTAWRDFTSNLKFNGLQRYSLCRPFDRNRLKATAVPDADPGMVSPGEKVRRLLFLQDVLRRAFLDLLLDGPLQRRLPRRRGRPGLCEQVARAVFRSNMSRLRSCKPLRRCTAGCRRSLGGSARFPERMEDHDVVIR